MDALNYIPFAGVQTLLLFLIILLLFYYIFAHSFLNQHEKKNSVDAQFHMLKQQMKPHEKLYTVTVKTKQGKRVVVVPKKQYDKIEKGKHIKVKNGVVQ